MKRRLFAFLFAIVLVGIVLYPIEVDAICARTYDGAYGFYYSRGSEDAMAVLDWGASDDESWCTTIINGEFDSTNLENMIRSLEYMDECNYLRSQHGLQELYVSDYMMAIAQVNANWSRIYGWHSGFFGVGENLAFMQDYSFQRTDPFYGWYTKEKERYEQGLSKSRHYHNIINPDYNLTGFAVTEYGTGSLGICMGQVFSDTEFVDEIETHYIMEPDNLYTCHNAENYDSFTDLPIPVKKETVAQYRAELLAYINAGGINPESLVENVSADSPLNDTPQVMYRIYNPNSGEHFYTSNTSERDNLVSAGWKSEGIGWTAPLSSNTPVYRLYNKNAGDHHYTMNRAEVINLLENGWSYEGIGWYSDPQERSVLYRLYNPNAVSGSHHYTFDYNEALSLQSKGWSFEDIGWYGL